MHLHLLDSVRGSSNCLTCFVLAVCIADFAIVDGLTNYVKHRG